MSIASNMRDKAYSYLVDNDPICRTMHMGISRQAALGKFEFVCDRHPKLAPLSKELETLRSFLVAGGFDDYVMTASQIRVRWVS